jgi:hypothetical protein
LIPVACVAGRLVRGRPALHMAASRRLNCTGCATAACRRKDQHRRQEGGHLFCHPQGCWWRAQPGQLVGSAPRLELRLGAASQRQRQEAPAAQQPRHLAPAPAVPAVGGRRGGGVRLLLQQAAQHGAPHQPAEPGQRGGVRQHPGHLLLAAGVLSHLRRCQDRSAGCAGQRGAGSRCMLPFASPSRGWLPHNAFRRGVASPCLPALIEAALPTSCPAGGRAAPQPRCAAVWNREPARQRAPGHAARCHL